MPSVLLSGPAGAAKSAYAKGLFGQASGLVIIADFQSFYAALTGDERGPNGRYPLRNERLLPITEYVRRAAITGAVERDIQVIATNSDGDPVRRKFLLSQLGADATERVIDPGRDVVSVRLADPATGELSLECDEAINRWYGRRR